MACDVNDGVLLFSLWQHLASAHLLNQSLMNRIETVLLSLAMVAELLPIQCGPVVQFFLPICLVQVPFGKEWTGIVILAISVLLGMYVARCAGLFFRYFQTSAVSVAIWIPSSASTPQVGFSVYVKTSSNSRGKIEISASSAKYNGGAMLRSSSGVFGTILRWLVGSGRSTLGSENRKELKRLPSIVATKLDCQLMFVYSPFCLRLSLFLSMFFVGAAVEGLLRQLQALLQNNMKQWLKETFGSGGRFSMIFGPGQVQVQSEKCI